MVEERGINESDMLIRIGMDSGGGFMKMCMSIFELDSNSQGDTSGYGKRLDEKFKDSGVKKIMVIAIVNVKRLWMEAGIDMLERKFTLATDLKLCNILLCLMSHRSCHIAHCHPCCWCDIGGKSGQRYRKGLWEHHPPSYVCIR